MKLCYTYNLFKFTLLLLSILVFSISYCCATGPFIGHQRVKDVNIKTKNGISGFLFWVFYLRDQELFDNGTLPFKRYINLINLRL